MDPLNHLNSIERNICNKADLAGLPIAGNFELLPLCNMDCKMCFAKMTRKEMESNSPMHDYIEWLDIAKQSSEAGTIFLLLTGGEPFLYPNLKELYGGLKKLGFIISINTNGTLITDEIVDWLAENPPRRLNITLYGASNDTYAKLCGNPNGFSQVMTAVEKLKKRNISIKFNCSLTPYNIHDQEAIYRISQELDIPMEMGFYMFPPIRKNNIENKKYRLSPKEAAMARYRMEELMYGENHLAYVESALKQYYEYKQTKGYELGYTCRAGNSVYWINYDGTMSACSFTSDCKVNVFEQGFRSAWEQVHNHVSESRMSEKCHNCKMRILCPRCASAAISETGRIEEVPNYCCELTKHYTELLERNGKKDYENKP